MSRISKKLSEWQSKGLITPTQAASISTYEASLPSTNWGLIGFLILSVGTVVLGIISLIAYNWHTLSDTVKLLSGFALLFLTSGGVFVSRNRASLILHNGLIAFFILYCFAMIGLIAQVFHLSGEGFTTGLFWSAMTLLLVTCATHIMLPLFWSFVFTSSLLWALYEWAPLKDQFVSRLSFFALVLALIVFVGQKFIKETLLQKSFMAFAVFYGVLATFCFSFKVTEFQSPAEGFSAMAPLLIAGILSALLVSQEKSFKKIVRVGLLAVGVLFILSAALKMYAQTLDVVPVLLGIAGLFCWALIFFAQGFDKLSNLMMLLIGLKLFEIFVHNSSDLIRTGIGLIISGTLAGLAVYAWNKNKVALENYLQKVIQ